MKRSPSVLRPLALLAACHYGNTEEESLGFESRGCGCATPGSDDGRWLAWGVALLALAARRRRRAPKLYRASATASCAGIGRRGVLPCRPRWTRSARP